MLKPAQLYKEELQECMLKSWYKPENIYWHSSTTEYLLDIPEDNGEYHNFASIDKNDNVIGYITYRVDWITMSASWFGIISFDKGNIEFIRDILQAIYNCFEVYHLNRIEWCCYADNPAIRGYRNFIKKYGGRECGYFRQCSKLMDGKLHDSVSFEILSEEFHNNYNKHKK